MRTLRRCAVQRLVECIQSEESGLWARVQIGWATRFLSVSPSPHSVWRLMRSSTEKERKKGKGRSDTATAAAHAAIGLDIPVAPRATSRLSPNSGRTTRIGGGRRRRGERGLNAVKRGKVGVEWKSGTVRSPSWDWYFVCVRVWRPTSFIQPSLQQQRIGAWIARRLS